MVGHVIVLPGCAPLPLMIGHVSWQGVGPTPSVQNMGPITLTVKGITLENNHEETVTDISGFFTIPLGLSHSNYMWRVKGPKSLASARAFDPQPDPPAPIWYVEVGMLRGGDSNNDNVIGLTDFNILRVTFGKGMDDPGYDSRADFNNDNIVNTTDFTLLRGNFGASGAPPLGPSGFEPGMGLQPDVGTQPGILALQDIQARIRDTFTAAWRASPR
jgi:hypothetical protein